MALSIPKIFQLHQNAQFHVQFSIFGHLESVDREYTAVEIKIERVFRGQEILKEGDRCLLHIPTHHHKDEVKIGAGSYALEYLKNNAYFEAFIDQNVAPFFMLPSKELAVVKTLSTTSNLQTWMYLKDVEKTLQVKHVFFPMLYFFLGFTIAYLFFS